MEHEKNNSHSQHEFASPSSRTAPTQQPPIQKAEHSFVGEVVKFAILAILIVVPIRLFIAQPFIVSGASMEPTFETGEYLIVDQITYAFETPMRGDVIIFRYPQDPSKFFIKRVIGLPGETVRLRGKDVIIENNAHPSGFIVDEPYLDENNRESATLEVKLKDDEYFVLGDNRNESSDSRVWGPLKEEFLIGRALLRLFPLSNDVLLPGTFSQEE